MADKTKIEWAEASWNPTVGCSLESPGCAHCYAMRHAARLARMGGKAGAKYAGLTQASKAGPVWNGTVRLDEAALDQPLRWKRPRRIFVNSMSDLFHEALPDAAIDRVFAIMALAPQHTFLVLTKRAARMREYCREPGMAAWIWRVADHLACDLYLPESHPAAAYLNGGRDKAAWPLPNVWKLVSVEDQARADERIPLLLDTPAAVRGISAEPLLGPVDLRFAWDEETGETLPFPMYGKEPTNKLHWVIAGGESGPGARPRHPDLVRSLRDQCVAAGVPFFLKQWGEWLPTRPQDPKPAAGVRCHEWNDGVCAWRVGKKRAGRLLDGREWNEAPG